jgi:hypothetical protein
MMMMFVRPNGGEAKGGDDGPTDETGPRRKMRRKHAAKTGGEKEVNCSFVSKIVAKRRVEEHCGGVWVRLS